MTQKGTQVKWILADIGDVLLIKNNPRANFRELLAQELGVDLELAQEINRMHFTTMDIKFISEQEFIHRLKTELDYDAPKDIFARFSRAYEKQALPNVALFDFLKDMRSFGIKTAILSNTIAIYQPNHEQLGISKENGFDPILYSWREEMKKPDEHFFKLAIDKLGAEPEEILFIDDKLKNITAAQQLGMNAIVFDIENTGDAIEKIAKQVDRKIS